MKKGVIFLSALLLLPLAAQRKGDLDGVSVTNPKIPFYNRNVLQSMIFADKAEYRSRLLYGHNVVINMLRKQIDPDRIRNDWQLKIYPLNAPLTEIAKFWAPRTNYCDAVILSPEGVVNQAERSAGGDKKIRLRSPLLDLDGTGFAADFKRRQLKVNSEVQIVLRNKKCDPRVFGSKVPARYDFIRGTADMLHMDTDKRSILLLGRVVIIEGKMKLSCDRLTILLDEEKKLKEKSSMNFSGISMLNADGNVKIEKILPAGAPPADAQELTGEHLSYDVKKEQLTVTGDSAPPMIKNGKGFLLRGKQLVFFRSRQQMIVPADCRLEVAEKGEKRFLISDYGNFNFNTGICDFLGNVRVSTVQEELGCAKMRIFLTRTNKKKGPAAAVSSADSPLSSAGDLQTGSMEFSRALCRGSVKMFRRENKGVSTLDAREAELNYGTNSAVFSGNVRCVSAGSTLDTPRLAVRLAQSRVNPAKREIVSAETFGGLKITGAPAAPGGAPSFLLADRGFFDYAKDRIDFSGNVTSKRGNATLTGDRLELFLAPRNTKSAPVAIPGAAAGAMGSSRTLKRAVASGNAVMNDGKNKLSSDRIEYIFTDAQPKAAKKPGLFQSGALRLSKVKCDGKVHIQSGETKEPLLAGSKAVSAPQPPKPVSNAGVMVGSTKGFKEVMADHLVTDFIAHTSLLTQNVAVTDGESRMDCGRLEFFAVPQKTAAAKKSDPDADPFDLPSEGSVPSEIIVGQGLALDRAVATENVVFNRRKQGEKEGVKLNCDKAFFNARSMTIECTGTEGRRPKAEGMGKTHSAEKFTIYLKDERIESSGDSITE